MRELSNHRNTIALFLCQSDKRGEEESEQVHSPVTKATLCLVERAIIAEHFQLSRFSSLKRFAANGRCGLFQE